MNSPTLEKTLELVIPVVNNTGDYVSVTAKQRSYGGGMEQRQQELSPRRRIRVTCKA